jgi:hypothetical protein
MSRLEIPLRHRTLWRTGDVRPRAELDLALKTNQGTWEEIPFLVDSGTEMTSMPASEAKKLDLPIPRNPVPGLTLGLAGQEVRTGLLRARIVGMDATEYVFPCYFLGDPDSPLPKRAKNLLGLSGVIDQIRFGFDGTPSVGAPYGVLIVEKR